MPSKMTALRHFHNHHAMSITTEEVPLRATEGVARTASPRICPRRLNRRNGANPREDLVPRNPRIRATNQVVFHCLHDLVTEHTNMLVLQPSSGKSLRYPTAVLASHPQKEFDHRRGPRLPTEIPRRGLHRAHEHCLVARGGRITSSAVHRHANMSRVSVNCTSHNSL
jgi:hypothetical protein